MSAKMKAGMIERVNSEHKGDIRRLIILALKEGWEVEVEEESERYRVWAFRNPEVNVQGFDNPARVLLKVWRDNPSTNWKKDQIYMNAAEADDWSQRQSHRSDATFKQATDRLKSIGPVRRAEVQAGARAAAAFTAALPAYDPTPFDDLRQALKRSRKSLPKIGSEPKHFESLSFAMDSIEVHQFNFHIDLILELEGQTRGEGADERYLTLVEIVEFTKRNMIEQITRDVKLGYVMRIDLTYASNVEDHLRRQADAQFLSLLNSVWMDR